MQHAAPYRTFSGFLREHFGRRVQKITLDAGLSCPHRDKDKKGGCIYCNARGSGTGAYAAGIGLKEQIEMQMAAMKRRYKADLFIAYFQSYTNTYAPLERLKSIYDTILDYPEIVGLAIGTRPDCIDRDILDLIESYTNSHLVWIEYGLQSANDNTLKKINRGHDVACFVDAVRLTSTYKMRICAHVIIGLPGEGMEDYLNTARLVSSLAVDDVKIHLLYVVKSTPMEILYRKGLYRPLEMDEYAHAVARFISMLPKDMVIQRITGDPHPDELVAPLWALDKRRVRDLIYSVMLEQGLYQGKYNSSENATNL